MRPVLDWLQVLFYVVAIAVLLAVGGAAIALLSELSTGLKQERLQHEQQRKDHATELKDHERLMQGR